MRAFLAWQTFGIATQGDDDLALHIQPGIVVEPEALIFQAIADEDQRRAHVQSGFGGIHADQHVAGMGEALVAGRAADGERRGGLCPFRLLEGDALEPASSLSIGVAGGLEAQAIKLAGDIAGGDLMPLTAGIAALEQIVGQEFDMGAHRGRGEDRIGQ